MNPSPLLLEVYDFHHVSVKISSLYKQTEDNTGTPCPCNLSIRKEFRRYDDNPDRWHILLDIDTVSTEDAPIPYDISLRIVGIFRTTDVLEEDKKAGFAIPAGVSILFSAAREFVLSITSRHPYGAFALPVVPVQNLVEQPVQKEETGK